MRDFLLLLWILSADISLFFLIRLLYLVFLPKNKKNEIWPIPDKSFWSSEDFK